MQAHTNHKLTKMNVKYYFVISIIFLFTTSCSREAKYIIETDFSKLLPDTINGEIYGKLNKKSQEFYKELLSNTIDRSISDIEIINDVGDKINLRNILHSETIIISADNHCAWGLECLTNDFPNALKKVVNANFRVVCLLKREESDINNQESFNNTFNELKQIYESVYIIEEK